MITKKKFSYQKENLLLNVINRDFKNLEFLRIWNFKP